MALTYRDYDYNGIDWEKMPDGRIKFTEKYHKIYYVTPDDIDAKGAKRGIDLREITKAHFKDFEAEVVKRKKVKRSK